MGYVSYFSFFSSLKQIIHDVGVDFSNRKGEDASRLDADYHTDCGCFFICKIMMEKNKLIRHCRYIHHAANTHRHLLIKTSVLDISLVFQFFACFFIFFFRFTFYPVGSFCVVKCPVFIVKSYYSVHFVKLLFYYLHDGK